MNYVHTNFLMSPPQSDTFPLSSLLTASSLAPSKKVKVHQKLSAGQSQHSGRQTERSRQLLRRLQLDVHWETTSVSCKVAIHNHPSTRPTANLTELTVAKASPGDVTSFLFCKRTCSSFSTRHVLSSLQDLFPLFLKSSRFTTCWALFHLSL